MINNLIISVNDKKYIVGATAQELYDTDFAVSVTTRDGTAVFVKAGMWLETHPPQLASIMHIDSKNVTEFYTSVPLL
jgi:hypothetical protein